VSELEASLKLNVPQLSQSMETESPDAINHTAIQQTSLTVTTDPATKPPHGGFFLMSTNLTLSSTVLQSAQMKPLDMISKNLT